MSTETEQDDVVRREVELDGAPARVWALLADPAGLASWLADEVWLDEVAPGAEGLVRAGEELRRVVVDEVEAERRLALRWSALPDGEVRLVELTVDEIGPGRTRLVVVELPWATVRAIGPAVAATLPAHGPLMAV